MVTVLCDVDGTLVAGGASCEALFVGYLLRRGVLGPRQCAAALAFPLRWGGRFGRHVLRNNKAYLAGLAPEEVAALGAAFVSQEVMGRLRPAMARRIADHIAAGDRTALLTGAPEFIARPLAEALGIGAWRATRPALENGVYGAGPPLAHPFGAAKLAPAAELCRALGGELKAATAYADSVYDLALLAAVGRPVAVHPDRPLARLARRRGWEIMAA